MVESVEKCAIFCDRVDASERGTTTYAVVPPDVPYAVPPPIEVPEVPYLREKWSDQ